MISYDTFLQGLGLNLNSYQRTFVNIIESDTDQKGLFILRTNRGQGKTYTLMAEAIYHAAELGEKVLYICCHDKAAKMVYKDISAIVINEYAIQQMSDEIRFLDSRGIIEVWSASRVGSPTTRGQRFDWIILDDLDVIDANTQATLDYATVIADRKIMSISDFTTDRIRDIWNSLHNNKVSFPASAPIPPDPNAPNTVPITVNGINETVVVKKPPSVNVITVTSAERMIEEVIKQSKDQDKPLAMSEVYVTELIIGFDPADEGDFSAMFTQQGNTGFGTGIGTTHIVFKSYQVHRPEYHGVVYI